MKIHEAGLLASSGLLQGTREAGATASSGESVDPGAQWKPADRVQLSKLSGRLLEALRAEAPDRAARVARLAAEVSAGRYRPDAAAIGREVVEEALHELSG
jgi:hypothetical protein